MAKDRIAIAFNVRDGDSVCAAGAKGYVRWLTGNPDRLPVLVRSRGGRLVKRWMSTKKLHNFRTKNLPLEHPQYEEAGAWVDPLHALLICKNLNGLTDA